MTKLFGAIFILFSGVFSSFRVIQRINGRVRFLQDMCSALEMMKSEVSDRLSPLEDVMSGLVSEQGAAGDFFRNVLDGMKHLGDCSFYSIWKSAVCDIKGIRLEEGEKQALCEIGLYLGRYGYESQGEMLNRALQRFEVYRKRAEAERASDVRMQGYLSVISCIFVVIVLL